MPTIENNSLISEKEKAEINKRIKEAIKTNKGHTKELSE